MMLAISVNIIDLFYNLSSVVVAGICIGIITALILYRFKRIHDIAKLKCIQEWQPHEDSEMNGGTGSIDKDLKCLNPTEIKRKKKEKPGVMVQANDISEKSDDLSYLYEESTGTAPADETIETVDEIIEHVSANKKEPEKENVTESGGVPETNIEKELISKLDKFETEINIIKDEIATIYEQVALNKEGKIVGNTNKVEEVIETKAQDILNIVNNNALADQENLISSTVDKIAGSVAMKEEIEVREPVPDIPEKPDDLSHFVDELASAGPSDKTIETVEEIAEPVARNEEAQFNLGAMYSEGKGVEQDYKEAARWYSKAAVRGHAEAQNCLGTMSFLGKGVEQDYKEAVGWWRKAAIQGYPQAQFSLGTMYFKGIGIEQDYKEAVDWYRKAAKRGSVNAQYNLASVYAEGQGVDQDYEQAVRWCLVAAKGGLAQAQAMLGVMYSKGQGVKQNTNEAVKWYQKAAEQGVDYAKEALSV